MTGPTHILFGVASGVALCRLSGMELDPVSLVCLLIGSLSPDIDADGGSISKPGKIFKGFLPWRLARVLDELGQVISAIARSISGHRGFFHTPIIGILILLVAWYFNIPRLEWFSIGYLSHIFADACTVYGVPLLWPLIGRNYSFSPIRTGSALEGVLAIGLCIGVVYSGWDLLPQRTKQGFVELKQSLLKIDKGNSE
jgi:inner membrane protein